MWDITYPILVMEDTQIIVVNIQNFPLWALGRPRRMDSGSLLHPSGSNHSKGLWVFSPSTPHDKGIAFRTASSRGRAPSVSCLELHGLYSRFASPLTFSPAVYERFLMMWFYSVFETKAAGVTTLRLLVPRGPLSAREWSCPGPDRGKGRACRVLIIFCLPRPHFLGQYV